MAECSSEWMNGWTHRWTYGGRQLPAALMVGSIQPIHETTQMSLRVGRRAGIILDRKSTVTPAHSVGCSVGRKGAQLWTPTGCQSPGLGSPCPGFWYTLTVKKGHLFPSGPPVAGLLPAFADGPWPFQASALHTSSERFFRQRHLATLSLTSSGRGPFQSEPKF